VDVNTLFYGPLHWLHWTQKLNSQKATVPNIRKTKLLVNWWSKFMLYTL